jgi:hypothetical protein
MTQTLSLSPLSLNLPSSRMSVDFSSFTTDFSIPPASYSDKPRTQRPQYVPRKAVPLRTASGPPLPELPEEPSEEPTISATPSRQNSLRWPWRKSNSGQKEQSDSPIVALARTNSTTSMTSTGSTAVSSIFSRANSVSTHTSSSSTLYLDTELPIKGVSGLLDLPLSLLEEILSYSLGLPLQVSVGPEESDSRHMHHRYHRAGLDYVDLRQVLRSPLFLVSHHIREVTLDVFHRKSDFVIDLHRIYHSKVSSTINANLKRHQKFWVSDTPTRVKESLQRLSKLHLRLPVPSTEAAMHRDRNEDDWMDGSDGKGGGNWKVRSMKKEQEDALEIQKCVEAIKELVVTDTGNDAGTRTLSRSRSAISVRRTKSVKSARSKSADNADPRGQSMSNADDNGGERAPLKRLEIVFVKRSPWALVLPESLGLVRAFRSVSVSGYTKYYFELNGQRFIWATKHRKRWQGMEPDGPRLLNGVFQLFIHLLND